MFHEFVGDSILGSLPSILFTSRVSVLGYVSDQWIALVYCSLVSVVSEVQCEGLMCVISTCLGGGVDGIGKRVRM